MAETKIFRAGVFSVVKHCYLPRAVAEHPRFELVVVTDDADQPDWVHERNQKFADEFQEHLDAGKCPYPEYDLAPTGDQFWEDGK